MNDIQQSPAELAAEILKLRARLEQLEEKRLAAGGPEPHRLPALLEQIPAIVWALDRDFRLTWWRGGGIQTMGLDADAMIGVDLYTYVGTNDPTMPAIAAHRAALAGDACRYEFEEGGRVLEAHVEPLLDEAGEICGVIGVALDITERVHAEADRERLIAELQSALERVKTLSGLIPICMHCKSVRDDQGYWQQVDTYVRDHSLAEFSHGICPDCMRRVLPTDPP